MEAAGGVFPFRDVRWDPDPTLEAMPAVRLPAPAPLVLDNGSFQLRLGWACLDPAVPGEPLLRFRSLVARSRGARGGAGPETQVGNDLGSPEPLRWLLRSPFDRNVPSAELDFEAAMKYPLVPLINDLTFPVLFFWFCLPFGILLILLIFWFQRLLNEGKPCCKECAGALSLLCQLLEISNVLRIQLLPSSLFIRVYRFFAWLGEKSVNIMISLKQGISALLPSIMRKKEKKDFWD
ncbi:hypothetical protein JD844_018729 [Phrynosoma platyrhinos]|uniref:Uncharacterized protein n=1 Tax=Phrynosoma platyrhinos TaxID=52577 RepID=A0ABQ7SP66_PHRPL|nr:hypothetical protein JD844_018729 [Phrynosoma platyrhinos]